MSAQRSRVAKRVEHKSGVFVAQVVVVTLALIDTTYRYAARHSPQPPTIHGY